MRFLEDTHINFLGKKYFAIGLSWIVIAVCIGYIAINGLHLGIDFVGGNLIHLKFQQAPSIEEVRSTLATIGYGNAILQADEERHEVMIRVQREETQQAEANGGEAATEQPDVQEQVVDRIVAALTSPENLQLSQAGKLDINMVGKERLTALLVGLDPLKFQQAEDLPPTMTAERYARSKYEPMITMLIDDYRENRDSGIFNDDNYKEALDGLQAEFEDIADEQNFAAFKLALDDSTFLGSFSVIRAEMVSAVVGTELGEQALQAILFSLGGILVYIWFRFNPRFSVAAIIATIHDVIITVGIFTMTGREFNLPIVAAVLTIVGYSLNDTIVIFVRIREDLNMHRKEAREDYEGLLNESINNTLSRTLLTSGTTLIVVLFLFFLGGSVINDFAFTLIVGIVVGTFSSIYVASPILSIWQKITGNTGGMLAKVKYGKAS